MVRKLFLIWGWLGVALWSGMLLSMLFFAPADVLFSVLIFLNPITYAVALAAHGVSGLAAIAALILIGLLSVLAGIVLLGWPFALHAANMKRKTP